MTEVEQPYLERSCERGDCCARCSRVYAEGDVPCVWYSSESWLLYDPVSGALWGFSPQPRRRSFCAGCVNAITSIETFLDRTCVSWPPMDEWDKARREVYAVSCCRCPVCGRTIDQPSFRNGWQRGGHPAAYCCHGCEKRAALDRAKRRRLDCKPRRQCLGCDEWFQPRDKRQLHCSGACRVRAWRANRECNASRTASQ